MKNTHLESAHHKTEMIFREAFGDRASRLFSAQNVSEGMKLLKNAFRSELNAAKGEELGFNMSDWGSDAAFVIALQLYPEKFTDDEIQEGTKHATTHISYHAMMCAKLLDIPFADPATEDDSPSGSDPTKAK